MYVHVYVTECVRYPGSHGQVCTELVYLTATLAVGLSVGPYLLDLDYL